MRRRHPTIKYGREGVAWHGMSSQRFTLGSANITRDTGHSIGSVNMVMLQCRIFCIPQIQTKLLRWNPAVALESAKKSIINSCVMKLSAFHLRTKQRFFGISSFSSTSCSCCHKKWTNISTSSHQQPQPERNATERWKCLERQSEHLTTRFILGPDSSANERLEGVLWRSLLLSIALMPDLEECAWECTHLFTSRISDQRLWQIKGTES